MKTIHIIGGGILGFTTAFYLATSEFASQIKIKLYDQSQVGRESSWAGAGLLCPLMFWNYPDELNQQVLSSLKEYPRFIQQLQRYSPLDPEFDQLGLTIYDLQDETIALEWLKKFKYPYSYHSDDKKLYLPEIALVRNPRLIQTLHHSTLRLDIKVIEHHHWTAEALNEASSKNLDDIWIVTAGAWTKELLPNYEVYPIRGQILLFKTHEQYLKTAIYKHGKYIIPRRDGHILVGSSVENVGFNKSTTDEVYQQLFEFSEEFIGKHDPKFMQQWAGLRPASDHVMPFIEQVRENVFVNAGHFRYGVTQAPISALKIKALISDYI